MLLGAEDGTVEGGELVAVGSAENASDGAWLAVGVEDKVEGAELPLGVEDGAVVGARLAVGTEEVVSEGA